jgi:hypothetical protein
MKIHSYLRDHKFAIVDLGRLWFGKVRFILLDRTHGKWQLSTHKTLYW